MIPGSSCYDRIKCIECYKLSKCGYGKREFCKECKKNEK